jgi:hypothetical protein
MADLEDFEIDRSGGDEDEPGSGPGGPRDDFPIGLAVAAAVGVALVAGLGYFALRRAPAPKPVPPATATTLLESPSPVPSPTATPSPSSGSLPPLDQSDAFVRELAGALSKHPQLALWLAQEGLIERLTAVVENIVAGANPRTHLGFLAPRQRFAVLTRKGRVIVDPKSYEGYDAFADGVESLDAAGCARAYRVLEPLFDAAYRDLGHPEGRFRVPLAAAMARLSEVPVLAAEVALRPVTKPILLYQYVDPKLEGLSPAQKMLLRTGPRNVAKLQAKLKEIHAALGLAATGPQPLR